MNEKEIEIEKAINKERNRFDQLSAGHQWIELQDLYNYLEDNILCKDKIEYWESKFIDHYKEFYERAKPQPSLIIIKNPALIEL